MKVTRMKNKAGETPSTTELLMLMNTIKHQMNANGFITDVTCGDTRRSMKIGLHMCGFRINTELLGYNHDYGHHGRTCKAGYKLTNVPTWRQREEFNHIVNDCFDEAGIDAKIRSGHFEIRNPGTGRVDQWEAFSSAYCGGERLFEIRGDE